MLLCFLTCFFGKSFLFFSLQLSPILFFCFQPSFFSETFLFFSFYPCVLLFLFLSFHPCLFNKACLLFSLPRSPSRFKGLGVPPLLPSAVHAYAPLIG